jgi:hypothetical protein
MIYEIERIFVLWVYFCYLSKSKNYPQRILLGFYNEARSYVTILAVLLFLCVIGQVTSPRLIVDPSTELTEPEWLLYILHFLQENTAAWNNGGGPVIPVVLFNGDQGMGIEPTDHIFILEKDAILIGTIENIPWKKVPSLDLQWLYVMLLSSNLRSHPTLMAKMVAQKVGSWWKNVRDVMEEAFSSSSPSIN